MAMVNIPSTNVDPQYRYKMPRLISKMEGRGNGIKTCIVNMGDVARALNRPPQYATKWFGSELGVQSHYTDKEGEGECCKIDGSHDISAFQHVLDGFIDKYVCCRNCHLPEVDMYIKSGVIRGKCKACGWANELDNKHRVAHFITKHPPDESGLRLKAHAGTRLNKKALRAVPEVDSDFTDYTDWDDEDDFTDSCDSGGSSYDERDEKKNKKEKKEKKDKKDKKHKKAKKEKKSKKEKVADESEEDTFDHCEEDSDSTEKDSKEDNIAYGTIQDCLEETIDMQKHESQQAVIIEQPVQMGRLQAGSLVRGYGSPEIAQVIKNLQDHVEKSGKSLTVENFFDELRVAQLAEVFDHKMRLYVVLEESRPRARQT
jgi:translation initiation factor 5